MNGLVLLALVPVWSGEECGDTWVNGGRLVLLVALVCECENGLVG